MKKVYDLYGCDVDDLDVARAAVEAALGLTLAGHESLYRGVYYRWGQPHGEELVLQKNFDDEEQEYQEDGYTSSKVLLYVNLPRDPDKTREALASGAKQFVFLERREA